jgi:uncharacterized membrane protein
VTDFLLGLVLVGLAAFFAVAMRLQVGLSRLEERLDRAGIARLRKAGEAADGQPDVDSPSLANFFENLVGGRLLIWVGGAALFVAAIFLINYSIEIGLITPQMRMIAAALFGFVLLGLGEWARVSPRMADDRRVSQALVGVGLAVLYASVYGSYWLYGFLGINTASLLMLAITIASLGLSFRHGVGTAALGLIGGFLTPALVGDPDSGALGLLAYLALLDIAVFVIAWRLGWGWLAGFAVLASFVWTGFFVFAENPADAIAAGWFAVGLGIVAGLLRPAGTSLTWIQPVAIAASEVMLLTARGDVETWGWLAYAVIAIASVAITRLKEHVPVVPFYVLLLGLLLIPVRVLFHDESGVTSAAAGMIALFGLGSLIVAMEYKSGLWAALSAVGFGAPALVLRWSYGELLTQPTWGALLALLALGPVALVFIRRRQIRDGLALDFLALLPALTAAALLAFAAVDLVRSDTLSIAWLVLSIALIGAGMVLHNLAFRIAGLALLTVTVVKMFVIDAFEREGLLQILSFASGGVSLIVLGWLYGKLLRGERSDAADERAASGEKAFEGLA